MAERTVLLRFWPDVAERVRATVASRASGLPVNDTAVSERVAVVEGSFDIACTVDLPADAEGMGAAGLGLAEAIGAGRVSLADVGPGADTPPPARPGPRRGDPFAAVPAGVGVWLLRAADGWLMMAAPDRETWLSISMTFLRKRFFSEHDHASAWRSAEVNQLATLVLGTHRAEDVEGTSATYGIPCLALHSWADAAEAELAGNPSLEATRSSQLASVLQYGAILAAPRDERENQRWGL